MNSLSSVNDGQSNASPAIQELLDARGDIVISPGDYLLGETLYVHSDTHITVEPGATFRLADGVGKHCRNFIITNANPGNGNTNISLQGGMWDANNAGNPRGEEYGPFAYTGVAINFTNVNSLTLRDLRVHNPEGFFIRVGEVRDFHIENITLSADVIRPNQDGVHVGGFSERGVIRSIQASGAGVPNDDMVALNADDDVERQLNIGMRRGPIRDILIEDIEAEDAYTFIRLLSVDQPVEDVTIRRLRGGCRVHGINLNNWRFPKGVGAIRRVTMEDIDLAKTEYSKSAPAIIKISLKIENATIQRVHRRDTTHADVKTLTIDNDHQVALQRDGQSIETAADAGFIIEEGDIDHLRLTHCRQTQ